MSDSQGKTDTPFPFRTAAILGATGPTGRAIAAELDGKGVAVRASSRNRDKLEQAFGDSAEIMVADLLSRKQTITAVDGCDVAFLCYGSDNLDKISDHPIAARNLAHAIEATGARAVHVSSYWSYLPMRGSQLSEDTPRAGGSIPMRARRQAEDILQEAGAAIAHLPDFFGPWVHTGTLQRALEEATAGKTINWMGPKSLERDYLFVPDAARLLVALAGHEAAYGQFWMFPGAGPISARDVQAMASAHLGRRVGLRAYSGWMLRLLSHVNADLQAFLPLLDDYLKPVRYESGRLEALLGEIELTDYHEAVGRTLDWLNNRK